MMQKRIDGLYNDDLLESVDADKEDHMGRWNDPLSLLSLFGLSQAISPGDLLNPPVERRLSLWSRLRLKSRFASFRI